MGFLDETTGRMTDIVSRVMDYTDQKSQIMQCQSELRDLDRKKTQLLAALGKAVLAQENGNPTFAQTYAAQTTPIAQIEQQQASIRQRLETLRRMDTTAEQATLPCSGCGNPVSVATSFCPNCGTSVADTKRNYRQCPSCGAYWGADALFCERCGTNIQTPINVPVQNPVTQQPSADPDSATAAPTFDSSTATNDIAPQTAAPADSSAMTQMGPQQTTCPSCGTPAKPGSIFCGECGHRLS